MTDNLAHATGNAGQRPPRRPRYRGTHPRRFQEKYKEHQPGRYPETVQKVLAGGKTPAGTHRPCMVAEILEVLAPQPGQVVVDCTLGYGGHAEQLLRHLQPGGRLLGLDADPIELPRTEARLQSLGFGTRVFTAQRTNFAGLQRVLASCGVPRVDLLLADLGVSSMQLDNPARGFSMKCDAPLDMRMNPRRGQPAAMLLQDLPPAALTALLSDNADEPWARVLGEALAGRRLATTLELAAAVRTALPRLSREEQDASIRRIFQALRIAVNDELSALDNLLRQLPDCLNPGGRAAILSFHSGEDRRVKSAFAAGLRAGWYEEISPEAMRPSPAESRANPRSAPARLRWARRTSTSSSSSNQ